MLDRQNLLNLMSTVAHADEKATTAFSYEGKSYTYSTLNETLRNELKELCGSIDDYRENKNTLFSIMEEVIDDVLPKKVEEIYGRFAEVKTFGQGQKPVFRRKVNARARAKQFITRVGLAGVYEVFKLGGSESFEVPTSALGGAGQVSIEEFMDGTADFAEILQIILEGLDEVIGDEIAKSMQASIGQLPAANRVSANGFDEAAFDHLLTVAGAYGDPVIYCTAEFANKLVPKEAWRYSDAMKEELWKNGRLLTYKMYPVVVLPQGFTDETNSEKVVDPGYCWIIPSGGDTRPVKVAFEGQTMVDDRKNADWSREVQVYRKVGVVTLMTNNICSYVDTALLGKKTTWDLTNGTITNNVGIDGVVQTQEVTTEG